MGEERKEEAGGAKQSSSHSHSENENDDLCTHCSPLRFCAHPASSCPRAAERLLLADESESSEVASGARGLAQTKLAKALEEIEHLKRANQCLEREKRRLGVDLSQMQKANTRANRRNEQLAKKLEQAAARSLEQRAEQKVSKDELRSLLQSARHQLKEATVTAKKERAASKALAAELRECRKSLAAAEAKLVGVANLMRTALAAVVPSSERRLLAMNSSAAAGNASACTRQSM